MTEERRYDEFFHWLDTEAGDIEIPTFFPELPGFKISASDFLAEHRRIVKVNGKPDYYCDALYDLWIAAKAVKDAQSSAKQGKNALIHGKIPC